MTPIEWVNIHPFRAQIRYWSDILTESEIVVALAIGFTLKQAQALTQTSVHRLSHRLAEGIWQTNVNDLAHELRLYVHAKSARNAIHFLTRLGWKYPAIAQATNLTEDEVRAVSIGHRAYCSWSTELRLISLLATPMLQSENNLTSRLAA